MDDNFVVYLHEDVADSSMGDENGGNMLADLVDEDDNVDVGLGGDFGIEGDNAGSEGGDAEPADLVADNSDDDPDSDADLQDDPGPQPLRKSVRFSRAPKVFSYDEIGGPPVLIDIRK